MLKRALDIAVSAAGLVLLGPLLLAVALLVKATSPGPALHRGVRVGRGGAEFRIFKFRTMVQGAASLGPAITGPDDARVTRMGRLLRRTKVDELPQLLNVLRGEMSIVGPRPEDPAYVALYTAQQRQVLSVRPGITGPASLVFRNEELLPVSGSFHDHYVEHLMPAKLLLDLAYVQNMSLGRDAVLIVQTLFAVVREAPPLRWCVQAIRRWVPWRFIDAPIVVAAFYVALLVRMLDGPEADLASASRLLALAIVPLILLYGGVNRVLKLDERVWRYARGHEVLAIVQASGLATLIALVADITITGFARVRPLPLSVLVIGGLLTFFGQVLARYRSRLLGALWEWQARRDADWDKRTRTVIYGAGESGQALAWRLVNQLRGHRYDIFGFVDDDASKWGHRIHGIPVLGSGEDLDAIVSGNSIDLVILAFSNVSGEGMRRILTRAQSTTAQIRIIPNVIDFMSRIDGSPLLRELRVEDLLGRQPVVVDMAACEQVLGGKVVMVTGGAGSVGSELCRAIAAFNPLYLVVLDNNESGLYELDLELRSQVPGLKLTVVVGDVTDAAKMGAAFSQFAPQIIFHAAAYKHVPLMERYPEEAVRVNVQGTMTVLDLALKYGAEHFVLVSTDKAVNPSSIMGATKRIAELLVMETAERSVQADPPLLCTAVRFGNVLGSRGSVVPTFAKQIELGGPVTVTHPEMTRYFMDLSEAAALIIQAASLTDGGDLFMLEMGERIRIDDLARKMIRIRGLRPDVDVPIVYTGIRPGEKLHEELAYEHEAKAPTSHPLINRFAGARLASGASGRIRRSVDRLLSLMEQGQRDKLLHEVMQLSGGSDRRLRDGDQSATVGTIVRI